MKYMLFICADPDVKLTPEQQTEASKGTDSWVKEMDGRGVRLQGDRLRPVSDATTVRSRNKEVLIADGPSPRRRSRSPAMTSSSARISTRRSRSPPSTPSPSSASSR